MKSIFAFYASLLFLISPKLYAQELLAVSPSPPDTISFRLTSYNNIVLEAVLNELDSLDLMFHTAANDMTLIEAVRDRLKSVTYGNPDSVNSWGGKGTSRRSSGNDLKIGNQNWEDVLIWENKHSGQETDGKIGLDFFKGQILEINYEQNYLVVHPEMPELDKGFEELALEINSGMRFLKGSMQLGEESFGNSFLIHSGYAGSLLLDDAFAQKNKLDSRLEIIDEKILKDSYGNELKTLKALMPAFEMGSIHFDQVPVGFFSGALGRQKISVMGGDLLKRFNWIFDLKEERLFVKPNANIKLAYRE
ncbi:MAG: aspartyl protease family protein [Bacteroidia bacterium]|nr:aspartyl protease family protein [Bacteroidia bacterium]